MKAIICKEHGPAESLVYEELPTKPMGKNAARIAVKASGVNFLDTLIIQGQYQVKPPLPFSPGCELAGEIVEVGEAVTNVKVGDRVAASIPWGGYADEAVLAANMLIPLSDSMSFAEGAALPVVYGTAIHALKQRANIQPGETLLVLGAAGGVGLATIQLGKIMGATVIAAAGSDERLATCTAQGADHVINYNDENLRDRVKEITGKKGADVIFDAVGGDYFDEAIRVLAWEGRLLVVGFAAGRIPTPSINRLLLNSSSLMGVFWGQFAQRDPKTNAQNFAQLMQWHAEGKYKPFIHQEYPLANAADALNAISNREVVGKAVLVSD